MSATSALAADFPDRKIQALIPTRSRGGADRNFRSRYFPTTLDHLMEPKRPLAKVQSAVRSRLWVWSGTGEPFSISNAPQPGLARTTQRNDLRD